MAANSNADLYEAMFLSQGLAYERYSYAFVGKDVPPPYYSNLTVLSPDYIGDVTEHVKESSKQFGGKLGLKDSFGQLDLKENGFEELFGASWIWCEGLGQANSSDWNLVENEAELVRWEEAWKMNGSPTEHRMFNAEMFAQPNVYFLGHKKNGKFNAGCIANHSGNCISISNVFSTRSNAELYFAAASAVASIDSGVPVVGYESGEDLEYAHKAGFQTVGELRILMARAATF